MSSDYQGLTVCSVLFDCTDEVRVCGCDCTLAHTICRENDVEECGLELFFNADFEILGKLEHHELKEGGDSIQVTEENKLEYIE